MLSKGRLILLLCIFVVLVLNKYCYSGQSFLRSPNGKCNRPSYTQNLQWCPPLINFTNCMKCDESHYTIRCYANKTVPVDTILNELSVENTKALEIIIDNIWDGYLPLAVPPINLSAISRLKNLERFKMQQKDFSYSQPFLLLFNEDSFHGLDKMSELSIRIPLQDRCLKNMIAPLTALDFLDLSFTRGLSLENVKRTLSGLNREKIQGLCLRTFQLIGADGYSPIFNITKLQNAINGSLNNLIEIDLSDNSLARITPGISLFAPKLQKFDISGNILLDSHNVPIIIESILHPELEEFNVGYQGYIGGGIPKGRNNKHNQNLAVDFDIKKDKYLTYNHASVDTATYADDLDTKTRGKEHAINIEPFLHQHDGAINNITNGINPFIVNCININTDGNISSIILSQDANEKVCHFLQCLAPVQFQDIPCRIFPNISDIFDINCHLYIQIPLGPKLTQLLFTHIHWKEAATTGIEFKGTFCAQRNNSLKSIIFASNVNWVKAGKIEATLSHLYEVRGLNKLSQLVLSDNNLTANISFLKNGVYMDNLEFLDLSHNFFIMNSNFQFCNQLKNLRILNLEFNNLTDLPVELITNCSKLEILLLNGNSLTDDALKHFDFNGTKKLKEINLSSNSFHIIHSNVRSKFRRIKSYFNNTVKLDLSGNRLICNCSEESLGFIQWIQKTNDVNLLHKQTYTCTGPEGYQFINQIKVAEMRHKCFHSNLILILISVSSTAVVALIISSSVGLYKFRWRLRYKWYILKQSMKRCCGRSDSSKRKWKYDAFVSYSADDRFWVHDVLMKKLEDHYGFKLCIHYRDFPVGGCIFETVSSSMNESQHIILVLSDISIASNMCQFEIDEAQRQAIQRQMSLLSIKLGHITKPIRNARVASLLDWHTYLEWADDKKTHKLFWAKLVGHLYDDIQGSCCSCCCAYGTKAIGYREVVDPQASPVY